MAWIELHETIREHPKTYALADALKIEQFAAGGLMVFLWTWALANAPEGDLSTFPAAAIARACFWTKKADVLITAMKEAGWLDDDMHIHDWQEYAGKLMERRERNADSMRRSRAKTRVQHVSHTMETREVHDGVTCKATVPNLTVPNQEQQRACARTREETDEDENGNPLADPAWQQVADHYLAQIGMLPGGKAEETLRTYADDLGADAVCLAITETNLKQPDLPMPFLLKMLENWYAKGVRDLAQAQALLRDRERKKQGGDRAHDGYARDPTPQEQPRLPKIIVYDDGTHEEVWPT